MAAPAEVDRVRAALLSATEIGPYFQTEMIAAQRQWRTVADLWCDAGCLSERVNTAREFLRSRTHADVELRACASISSLGLISRLLAPPLATACVAEVIPRLDPQRTHWRPVVGGPVPIGLSMVDGVVVGSAAEAATELERTVLRPCVEPVLTAYSRQFRLSPRVLSGNAASALAGAAGMLLASPTALRIDPVEVVTAMLGRPSLVGTGGYVRPFDDSAEQFFVRRSCCLFYRIPGGGTCGDCVLVPAAARLNIWRAASKTADDTPDPGK